MKINEKLELCLAASLKVNLLLMSKESCSFFEIRLFFWLDL